MPKEPSCADAKKAFFVAFSDRELWDLMHYIRGRFPEAQTRATKKLLNAGAFSRLLIEHAWEGTRVSFERLYQDMFQRQLPYILTTEKKVRPDLQIIIDAIPAIRESINRWVAEKQTVAVASPPAAPASEDVSTLEKFPEWPVGLEISHPNLGRRIPVTRHAWERFCKRYTRSVPWRKGWDYSRGFFQERLQELFREAVDEDLGQAGTIRRLIDNNLVPARYFLNKKMNLRFVVSQADKTLLTVETPMQIGKR